MLKMITTSLDKSISDCFWAVRSLLFVLFNMFNGSTTKWTAVLGDLFQFTLNVIQMKRMTYVSVYVCFKAIWGLYRVCIM